MPNAQLASRLDRVAENDNLAVALFAAGRRHRDVGVEIPIATHDIVRQRGLRHLAERHRDTERGGVVGISARTLGPEREVM